MQCRIGSPSISKWRMDSRIPITTAKAASELSMQIAQIYEGNDCSRVQWWCVVGFGNFNLLNARSRCSIIIYSHLPPVPTPANTVFTCHLALLSHHSSWTFSPLISRNPPRGLRQPQVLWWHVCRVVEDRQNRPHLHRPPSLPSLHHLQALQPITSSRQSSDF